MNKYDVVVIGGGPAGLSAAISAKENGAGSVLLVERDVRLGGILNQCIHNGFGLHIFKQELTGPEYASRYIDMLGELDITVMLDTMVLEITDTKQILVVNKENGYFPIQTKSIVLAMGCRERTRGALNIAGSRPSGIYTAGAAQYMVNMQSQLPGKRVVILGSGDIGLIMARRMTWEGAEVLMVCELMPFSAGLSRNIAQCLDDNDIPLRFSHTVVKIHGKERLEGITIAQVDDRLKPIEETYEYVECDTLLLSVGLIPENELTNTLDISMNPVTKGAFVDETRQTSMEGVFACGNVLHVHDLVDNVSMEAQIAGEAAARYCSDSIERIREIPVTTGEYVRYVLPNSITTDIEEIDLYYRVTRTISHGTVYVDSHSSNIIKKKKKILTPGEMQSIKIKIPQDAQSITIRVEEERNG